MRALPRDGIALASEQEDDEKAASAAGNSITVAAWTIVSRVTGVMRFAVIGAVLGPTFFGNTYQFTNSLPNLVYYGFLAGSMFSSLLVPALVHHVDEGDRRASERVAGGFLGVTLLVLLGVAPLGIILGPLVLRLATLGAGPQLPGSAQVQVGQLLILMFIPQIFFYGVVGTSTAVMNSRRRFALAAGAPALENLGTIAVLGAVAVIYGTGTSLSHVPLGEMLLLGLGSTGAVGLHAATQWWGARHAGVTLRPRAGWHDPEVRVVIRRALPSLGQEGLIALQVLFLLVLANRLPGGVIAFQIALNFYYLAIALGATPVALALLPRLARMHLISDLAGFRDTLVRGLALGFFITIPAAVGYLCLAMPLARAISFGRMDSYQGVQHGRPLPGCPGWGGGRTDHVHDPDLRLLRPQGHPLAAHLDGGAGGQLPGIGKPRAICPGADCAPRRRTRPVGVGGPGRRSSDGSDVAHARPSGNPAAHPLAAEIRGRRHGHGRTGLAGRHRHSGLARPLPRLADRHLRRGTGRRGDLPGSSGGLEDPRIGLACRGPQPAPHEESTGSCRGLPWIGVESSNQPWPRPGARR